MRISSNFLSKLMFYFQDMLFCLQYNRRHFQYAFQKCLCLSQLFENFMRYWGILIQPLFSSKIYFKDFNDPSNGKVVVWEFHIFWSALSITGALQNLKIHLNVSFLFFVYWGFPDIRYVVYICDIWFYLGEYK